MSILKLMATHQPSLIVKDAAPVRDCTLPITSPAGDLGALIEIVENVQQRMIFRQFENRTVGGIRAAWTH